MTRNSCQQRVAVVSLPDMTCLIPSDDWKTCLTSPTLLVTNAFMYFIECEEDKQFLTYLSMKLVETVSGFITLSDSKMAQVITWVQLKRRSQLPSRRWLIFNRLGFLVVRFTIKKIVDGIVRDVWRIAITWCVKQRKRSVSLAGRQMNTKTR